MTILDRIKNKKEAQLPAIRFQTATLKKRTRPRYSLKKRLHEDVNLSVIAEIKRGSPSLGLFTPALDMVAQSLVYQENGAAAVSVLTDEHFYGSYADLESVAPLLRLPILAKDFILDVAQINLADAAGADIILLIASILTPDKIAELSQYADERGLEVLLELHDADEIPIHRIPQNVIIGLNNRNLNNFEVSIENSIRNRKRLSDISSPMIAESGIHTPEQAMMLRDAGFSGMLIGESLIRSGYSGKSMREFSSIPRRLMP